MITELHATTTEDIEEALLQEEAARGSSRVLTLIIDTTSEHAEAALEAAHGASRDHPCRIVCVITDEAGRHSDEAPTDSSDCTDNCGYLDAQIRVGHDAGAGETIVLMPHGQAATHTDTLVVPFLLPDVPVVVWWPANCPKKPSASPLGSLARVRITNTPALENPAKALLDLAPQHAPGDIDLAWTRITLWRAIVASSLDNAARARTIEHVEVAGRSDNASVLLMAAWLRRYLGVPVTHVEDNDAVGIGHISARIGEANIVIRRHDADRVTVERPGSNEPQIVTMERREPVTTMNEELRRLGPDLVYQEVLASVLNEPLNSTDGE
ncbi:glucose-6-phosphate dehydrogenase assembly protein OpcA [Actinomyces vulturis]|uniref:glucose-6-phosphate dehydrogenase assembly protein OpcA n=1 Tax=Actinomyces vulturis TaxID=1857645 RepID=UPI000832D386|nr:glucose-6-phosphate dehydrogenase assembly protein OpcA [Actinomyces vulturis]